jgi:hypothetical protein
VAYLELIACRNKLRAIPKRCRRFNRRAIDKGGNKEGEPTHEVVNKPVGGSAASLCKELFHFESDALFFNVKFCFRCAKVGNNYEIQIMNDKLILCLVFF